MGRHRDTEIHPYSEGEVLSLRAHRPPQPFGFQHGFFYGESPREWNNYEGEAGFPFNRDAQISYVFDNPPIETVPPSSEAFQFMITKTVIGPKRQFFDYDQRPWLSKKETSDTEGLVEYDPNYFVPGPYYMDDLPELRRKDPHLPLDDEPYDGVIVVVGKVQLQGDQAPREYVARIYDGAYYPVSFDAEVQRATRKPDDGLAADCATRADFDYASEAAAYRLIQESPQPGPGQATLRFHGSWTFSLPGPESGTTGDRWVRMVLLEKIDAKPMSRLIRNAKQHNAGPLPSESDRLNTLKSLIDANEELWWWCKINCYRLCPHDVLICRDGTAKIINLNHTILHSLIEDKRFLRHPHAVYSDLSEDELKAIGKHISPTHRHWPFEVYTYTMPSWKVVEAPSDPSETERGPWEEWVPESWLENPEEAGIWLLKSYHNDTRFSPLDEVFLDHDDHQNRSPHLVRLLEQLGRKSEAELEALRFAELDETMDSSGDLAPTTPAIEPPLLSVTNAGPDKIEQDRSSSGDHPEPGLVSSNDC
ncbi:hypothetical protein QBC41DRAFT_324679 [Cercophora samala]|uniref:Uncharacterized protein n=1 Tax=Cercophora samala TaxID=330535 RepID=A0AA39ZA00_9PEZI|nr:hypothetical protein QBC41DRAFT_324679 [Cercophora samala]